MHGATVFNKLELRASVRLSVCHVCQRLVSCQNDSSYDHAVCTILHRFRDIAGFCAHDPTPIRL